MKHFSFRFSKPVKVPILKLATYPKIIVRQKEVIVALQVSRPIKDRDRIG